MQSSDDYTWRPNVDPHPLLSRYEILVQQNMWISSWNKVELWTTPQAHYWQHFVHQTDVTVPGMRGVLTCPAERMAPAPAPKTRAMRELRNRAPKEEGGKMAGASAAASVGRTRA